MTRHLRARTGIRRDGGVRKIRSDGFAYPDLGDAVAPQASTPPPPEFDSDGRRLSPALDTGLAVETRADRQQRTAARRRQIEVGVGILVVVAMVTALIGWRWVSDKNAAASPLVSETSGSNGGLLGGLLGGGKTKAPAAAATKSAPRQTPIFARYGKIALHLPVPVLKLTEIGFHQASYPYALRMKTQMKDADLSRTVANKSTGRNLAKQVTGPNTLMTGTVIRMWRNRPGLPDTAADVGALAGTSVLAPVSGTVVKIKYYKLYGKYPDYEMHIHPDGTMGVDVVMIHLTNVTAKVGDHVTGGITPVAKIRKLSDKFHDQLADYTRGGGDHVHIQVNDANYPGYKGLIGAITVPRDPEPAQDATGGTGGTGGSNESGSGADSGSGD